MTVPLEDFSTDVGVLHGGYVVIIHPDGSDLEHDLAIGATVGPFPTIGKAEEWAHGTVEPGGYSVSAVRPPEQVEQWPTNANMVDYDAGR